MADLRVASVEAEAKTLVAAGRNWLTKLETIGANLNGVGNLKKRISTEIKVLERNIQKKSMWLKSENVASSNLNQLGAIVGITEALENETHGVLQKFRKDDYDSLSVDLVACEGRAWIKVICRCPDRIHLEHVTGNKDGKKSLVDQAKIIYRCAENHLIFYSAPKVFLLFCKGVSKSVAEAITDTGCIVLTHSLIPDENLQASAFAIIDESFESTDSKSNNLSFNQEEQIEQYQKIYVDNLGTLASNIKIIVGDIHNSVKIKDNKSSDDIINLQTYESVSLDVTAMVAYTSNTCNGHANFVFKDKFLTEQAEWERVSPVMIIIDKYWKGAEILVCEETLHRYMKIVNTLAGEEERRRADELVKKIKVVPNIDTLEGSLTLSGNISESNRIIFGTSLHHKAPIITANSRFIRGAATQGYNIPVLLHSPRALTEEKQSDATPFKVNVL